MAKVIVDREEVPHDHARRSSRCHPCISGMVDGQGSDRGRIGKYKVKVKATGKVSDRALAPAFQKFHGSSLYPH